MARSIHFLRKPITTSQDLSEAVLDYTTSIGRKFKVEEICIHFSVGVTETVTVYRDSMHGANYDQILARKSLSNETDFVFRPTGENNYYNGDEVRVYCTNANATGVAYVEVKTSEM